MTEASNTIIPWLEHLKILAPPTAIALVGAGSGKGAWAQWLQTQSVPTTLVEADAQQFALLQRLQKVDVFNNTRLINSVVAEQAGEVDFFSASLVSESGLLAPENLSSIWPNLYTVQSQPRYAMALAELLTDGVLHQWLVLDCLPAAHLLHSAQAQLPQLDVVLARVLLAEYAAEELLGSQLVDVAKALPGFTQLALQPGRHPNFAYALFARNYQIAWQSANQAQGNHVKKLQAAQLTQSNLQTQLQQVLEVNADLLAKQEQQAQSQETLGADLAKSLQALDAGHKAKQATMQKHAALETQLQKILEANAELLAKQEQQAQEQQVLRADLAKSHQARLKSENQLREHIQKLADMAKECDEQSDVLQQGKKQLEELNQNKLAIEKQLRQLKQDFERQALEQAQKHAELSKARDEQAKRAQDRKLQIEQLNQAKSVAEKKGQEHAQQLDQLKLDLETQLYEQAQKIADLAKERDEQKSRAQDRKTKIEQLIQTKAVTENQLKELVQRFEIFKENSVNKLLEQVKLLKENERKIEILVLEKTAQEKKHFKLLTEQKKIEKIKKQELIESNVLHDNHIKKNNDVHSDENRAELNSELSSLTLENRASILFNELLVSLQEKINLQKEIFCTGDNVDQLNKSKRPPIYARWPKKGPVKFNFGDRLNPVIIRILSGRTVFNEAPLKEKPTTYLVIGSAAKAATEFNSVIWGMGYISHSDAPGKPGLVTAVRGPKTRRKMLEAGISCPEVYGDPALLLPYFYNPSVRENKGIGLILHYREFNDEFIRKKYECLGFRLINLNGKLSAVIKEIKASSIVISSSLHGLIMAHAYGIPTAWVKFSDLPLGDGFKFNDYLESMGFSNVKPVDSQQILKMNIDNMSFRVGKPLVDLKNLLANCPFLSHESVLNFFKKIKNSSSISPLLLKGNFA